MRSSTSLLLATVLVLFSLGRPVAAQQEVEPSEGDQAVALGNEGIELFEAGDWSGALDRFRQAEALYHSPVFVLYMARSLRKKGRLLEAKASYERVIQEKLAPDAFEPWRRAQTEAAEERTVLDKEIPRVVVVVKGASAGAAVTIDGRYIHPEESVEVNPGEHTVEVDDSGQRAKKKVSLSVGDERRVEMELSEPAQSAALPAAQAKPAPPMRTPPPPVVVERLSTPGLVVSAVGAAALVAGGVFGLSALRQRTRNNRHLPDTCQGTTCLESDREDIEARNDDAKRLGSTADVLYLGGAALTAVGLTLLVLDRGEQTRVEAGVMPRAGFVKVTF